MKRNYILLITLNIFNAAFAMQTDEKKAQGLLEKAQGFIKNRNYRQAIHSFNILNQIKKSESDPFAIASKKLEQELALVLKNAQKSVRAHLYFTVYSIINDFSSIAKLGLIADNF